MSPTLRNRLRAVTFIALALYIVGTPFYAQVLDQGRPKWIKTWRMFNGWGREVCDLRFMVRTDDGFEPVDRCVTLGYEDCWDAPKSVKRVEDRKRAEQQATRLCRKLGPDTDLRLFGRCGSKKRWRNIWDGSEDMCP